MLWKSLGVNTHVSLTLTLTPILASLLSKKGLSSLKTSLFPRHQFRPSQADGVMEVLALPGSCNCCGGVRPVCG